MQRHVKAQNEASQAVIALRKALGMTQQAFAHKIKAALTTVARWETSNPPPRGETLLKLADLAAKQGAENLARYFQYYFLDDIIPKLRDSGIFRTRPDGSGYAMVHYRKLSEIPSRVLLLQTYADRFTEYLGEKTK